MLTNHVALIGGDHVAVWPFIDEYIEVIEPEVGHHFFKLALAVDGAQQLGLGQLTAHHLLRRHDRLYGLALLRLHALNQLHGLRPFHTAGQRHALFRAHLQNVVVALVRRHLQQLHGIYVGKHACFTLLLPGIALFRRELLVALRIHFHISVNGLFLIFLSLLVSSHA